MASKGSGESREKVSPHHKISSHQGETKPSSNGEHQLSNHDVVPTHTSVQYGTQYPSCTRVLKASNEKPNFTAITTAEWMVHDKVQRWMEEGPGEYPWNSIEASSVKMDDQDGNEEQGTN